ncbi:MAG: O-methyltransferase [Bacteroidales bacterium]|nr:O-methyltransferase [Bacteroidales bacterium]
MREYAENHTTDVDHLLTGLDRETHLKVLYPRMLSGPYQGKFIEMLSRMIKPANILEIGTYTGYSTICLSRGLQSKGKIFTIEINGELKEMAAGYFTETGISDKVVALTGNALELIPKIQSKFDFVFIDADKEHYPDYFRLIESKLNPNGYILADNTLWDGKVILPSVNTDKETKGIVEFNRLVQEHNDYENILLTIRDGLMLIRKKEKDGF